MFKTTFKKLRSWHPVPSLHGKIDGETMETVVDFILEGSKITVNGDCSHEIKKTNDKPRQHIKEQRYYFAYKGTI